MSGCGQVQEEGDGAYDGKVFSPPHHTTTTPHHTTTQHNYHTTTALKYCTARCTTIEKYSHPTEMHSTCTDVYFTALKITTTHIVTTKFIFFAADSYKTNVSYTCKVGCRMWGSVRETSASECRPHPMIRSAQASTHRSVMFPGIRLTLSLSIWIINLRFFIQTHWFCSPFYIYWK